MSDVPDERDARIDALEREVRSLREAIDNLRGAVRWGAMVLRDAADQAIEAATVDK